MASYPCRSSHRLFDDLSRDFESLSFELSSRKPKSILSHSNCFKAVASSASKKGLTEKKLCKFFWKTYNSQSECFCQEGVYEAALQKKLSRYKSYKLALGKIREMEKNGDFSSCRKLSRELRSDYKFALKALKISKNVQPFLNPAILSDSSLTVKVDEGLERQKFIISFSEAVDSEGDLSALLEQLPSEWRNRPKFMYRLYKLNPYAGDYLSENLRSNFLFMTSLSSHCTTWNDTLDLIKIAHPSIQRQLIFTQLDKEEASFFDTIGDELMNFIPELSNDVEFWQEALKINNGFHTNIPDPLCESVDFMLEAIAIAPLSFSMVSEPLKSNPKIVERFVKCYNPEKADLYFQYDLYEEIDQSLRENKQFITDLIRNYGGYAILAAAKEVSCDRAFIETLLQNYPDVIYYLPESLKNDQELIDLATQNARGPFGISEAKLNSKRSRD